MSERLHRQVENHGGIRLSLRPRMGLPWLAHRDQSRPATGWQEIADADHGRTPRMPQVRTKNISTCSASNSSASACSGASTTVFDHDPAVRVGGAGDALRVPGEGASSIKDCARFTGASTTRRRWPKPKSNTKITPAPAIWVKYRADRTIRVTSCDAALQGKKVFTVIWTTTPWTLPASHGGGVSS